MANNPISFIDPDGGRAVLTEGQKHKLHGKLNRDKHNLTRMQWLSRWLQIEGKNSYRGITMEEAGSHLDGQYGWHGMDLYLNALGGGFADAASRGPGMNLNNGGKGSFDDVFANGLDSYYQDNGIVNASSILIYTWANNGGNRVFASYDAALATVQKFGDHYAEGGLEEDYTQYRIEQAVSKWVKDIAKESQRQSEEKAKAKGNLVSGTSRVGSVLYAQVGGGGDGYKFWLYTSDYTKGGLIISQSKGISVYSDWTVSKFNSTLGTVAATSVNFAVLSRLKLPFKPGFFVSSTSTALGAMAITYESRRIGFTANVTTWYGTVTHNVFTGKIVSVSQEKIETTKVNLADYGRYQERTTHNLSNQVLYWRTFIIRNDPNNWKPYSHPKPSVGQSIYDW